MVHNNLLCDAKCNGRFMTLDHYEATLSSLWVYRNPLPKCLSYVYEDDLNVTYRMLAANLQVSIFKILYWILRDRSIALKKTTTIHPISLLLTVYYVPEIIVKETCFKDISKIETAMRIIGFCLYNKSLCFLNNLWIYSL